MKTSGSLSRWLYALLDLFFAIVVVYVAIFVSIPAFALLVEDDGFWNALFVVLGLFGTILAPFYVWRFWRDAIRSLRHAIVAGKEPVVETSEEDVK